MHSAVHKAGLVGRDADYADSLVRAFKHVGVSAEIAERLLNWYGRHYAGKRDIDLDQFRAHFMQFAEEQKLPQEAVMAAFAWHGHVAEAGNDPDAVAPVTPTAGDAARLGELRTLLLSNPDLHDDPRISAEYHDLIAIGAVSAPAEGSRQSEAKPQSDRLAEIRDFRRSQPDAYDANKAMQAEELNLITNTTGASDAG